MKICLEKIASIVNGNLSFSESNQVGHFVRNMDEVSIFLISLLKKPSTFWEMVFIRL